MELKFRKFKNFKNHITYQFRSLGVHLMVTFKDNFEKNGAEFGTMIRF